MIAEAVIGTAMRADGTTSLPTLGSSPPLRLMPTPDAIYLVGAAAAPLNGDRISLEIYVAPGTEVTVKTVAASLAWPGTSPVPSQFSIRARVGEGGTLRWLPEPLVPVVGSVHRMTADIELASDAELIWREEVVLGRYRERPGELSSRLNITRRTPAIEGTSLKPLLRQELVIGSDGFSTPAVLCQMGATGSVTVIGERQAPLPAPFADDTGESATLELEDGGCQVLASATDAARLRALLDTGLEELHSPPTAGTRPTVTQPTSEPSTRSDHARLGT